MVLESERATLAVEKVEAFKASKALKAMLATISQKNGELNVARAALAATQVKALVDVVTARAAGDAEVAAARVKAKEEVAVARAEAEKVIEDEFGDGFFQCYTDLKRMVALVHPEWDLSAFLGVNSDYWDMEVSAEIEVPPTEVGAGLAKWGNLAANEGEVGARIAKFAGKLRQPMPPRR